MIGFNFKKLYATVFLCLILLLFPMKKTSADAWGANYAAAILKHTLEQIDRTIQGLLLGTAKQIAAKMVHETVGRMILGGDGGSSGGPLFITNWDQYLYGDVLNSANIVVNDAFTYMYRGVDSELNYAQLRAEGELMSYGAYLRQSVRESIGGGLPQADYQNYISDPRFMSNLGGAQFWRAYNGVILTDRPNTYFPSVIYANLIYHSEIERQRDIARTQAIAYQGFRAQKSGEEVLTPGSTIKDVQTAAENIGYHTIATAQSLPEVIVATVIQTTGEIIKQGIGNVRADVQRKINNTYMNVRRDLDEEMRLRGPGAVFRKNY